MATVKEATTEAPTSAKTKPRHIALGLSDKQALDMYNYLILARALDERWWVLNRAGKVHFVISCRGQEGTQVGAGFALEKGVDWVHPYYRDLALVLTMGMTPRDIMLDIFAKGESATGGRQMPGHWGFRRLKIVSGSSPVITQLPQACGIALAARIRGEKGIVLTDFGEGATAGGDFHEGLNWASIYKLPVIFLCENNQYAISEPQSREMAVKNVADRAAAYNMPGVIVDGNDVLAVYEAVSKAARRARHGDGPTLVEAKTYRLVPHSSDDDDRRYRSRSEVEEWQKRDPIERYCAYLEEQGLLDAAKDKEMRDKVSEAVNDATNYAVDAPFQSIEDVTKRLFSSE